MDTLRTLVFVFTVCCVVLLVRANTNSCLGMHDFVQTYSRIQTTVELLQTQMETLRGSLDTTVMQSCGDISGLVNHYQFNLTYCSFEDGNMCNYTQDTGDDGDFSLVTSPPDHTFGAKGGHAAISTPSSYYHTKMTSRPFNKATAYCFRFFYRLASQTSDAASYVDLFVKQEGAGTGYSILHVTNLTNLWKLAEVDVDPEYLTTKIQFQFSTYANYRVLIDDILVYNTHCSTAGVRQPVCEQGGLTRKDGNITSCYIVHVEPRTWSEAITVCKQEWPISTLVAIETAGEQNYLVTQIKANPAWSQTGDFGFWTTGNDEVTEGTFRWTETWEDLNNYTNWHAAQPNNVGGHQDCLLMQYKRNDYEWGDVDCSDRHPFICEMSFRL